MYVTNTPKQPAPRASHRTFRQITPALVEQEYRTLATEARTADAFQARRQQVEHMARRAAKR